MTTTPPRTSQLDPHGTGAPSEWVQRWSHLVARQGTVLDVACGQGRHLRWFAQAQHRVTGVDRSPEAIESVALLGEMVLADIESGPWPFMAEGKPRQFDAVIVTHYLWRPLLPVIVQSVAEGGVLIYETFAVGNETVGKPARADFLLRQGELLRLCQELRVVAYEDGFLDAPARFVQRIVAVREHADAELPGRYSLRGSASTFPG